MPGKAHVATPLVCLPSINRTEAVAYWKHILIYFFDRSMAYLRAAAGAAP
jgi:hypothetical protein